MLLISDTHWNPGDYAPDRCGTFADPLCIVGDSINILPFDLERWNTSKGLKTLGSIGDLSPSVTLIAGNHDPYNLLKKLPSPKNVRIVKRIETDSLLITHGHEFTYWRWLAKFAPQLCDFMTDKKLWYRFCKSRGWVASEHKTQAGFHILVAGMFINCARWCEKHKKSLIVGHSHSKFYLPDERDGWYLQSIYNDPVEVNDV